MKITWLGHACFYIETAALRIVTDPYEASVGYCLPDITADAVVVSHNHYDHNAVGRISGSPVVISAPGEHKIGSVLFRGLETFHDREKGKKRGKNLVFVIEADGYRLVHCGDLGEMPDAALLKELGVPDILMVPAGGIYTIEGPEAKELSARLKAKITIPMHYKTEDVTIPLNPLEGFTQHCDRVVKLPYLDLSEHKINSLPEVVVLDYHN